MIVIPIALSLATFGLYFRTTARTITLAHGGGDGPELSAAAAVLDIAHPPGYPLFMLLGHLFAQLPVGEVAFRVGLLSAVAAAIGAGLAAHLAATLTADLGMAGRPGSLPPAIAAVSAGGVLATSPMYWSQATIPEVYTLNAALVLLALVLLASWRPGRDSLVVVLSLLIGLGMGNHVTLIFLILVAVPFLLLQDPGLLHRRTALFASLAFLAGLALYLYLPIRAAANPPLNWGNPSDPSRFLALVTARGYQSYLGGRPLDGVLARVPVMAHLLISQLTWPGLLLAMVGLGELAERRPALFRMLIGYILLNLGFTLFYNAENGEVYMLPAVVVLAPALGLGLAQLVHAGWSRAGVYPTPSVALPSVGGGAQDPALQDGGQGGSVQTVIARARTQHPALSTENTPLPHPAGRILRLLAVAAMVAIPAWQLLANWSSMDISGDRSTAIYAQETLEAAPTDGILVTDRDEQTFPLWYAQIVDGLRPDVAVVDRRLLAAAAWYRSEIERQHPGTLERLQP